MNFIKRAFLSMKQRKVKSLIFLCIFFIVTNLVLAGFAIQNASQKASDLARKKLGADVTLKVDMEKALKKAQAGGNVGRFEVPSLNEKEVEKLAKSSYVKDYNFTVPSIGTADGFTPIKDEDNTDNQSGMMSNISGDLAIEGIRDANLEASFKDGTSKIVDGKTITADVKNKKVTLIEKRLAEKNNLKVGDKIKWKSPEDKLMEYEIIGIYKTEAQAQNMGGMSAPAIMNPANKLYVPYGSLTSDKESSPQIDKAVYYIKDPKYIEQFKKEAKKTDIDFDMYQLDAHDKLYKQMSGPIENIASISKMIVYVISIAGAVILGLIITLSIKERRKEIGILLSIGEKKWKLIGQLMVEILCVAVLAFGLSLTTGEKVSQKIGDKLLTNEIATTEEEPAPSVEMIGMDSSSQQQSADPIDKIDVSVTAGDLGKVGGIGIGITILSTLLPALSILRLKPKNILLKDE
ncbi:ABC transporter permease [Bacillus thuringiensis]|uniref:ABC transporter permease n=1 Tax=Bacillus thuringiensis serovar andalousiensis TaxID=257985 RepID=A0A6H0TL48_BACTU|nr:ABC transporter permease [Bacillus thuringiensis]QIW21197.1 ABC transporter permease [Bacillus thuringiensis serovar andalousiensis]